jgi:hypothetical protein
MQATNAPEPAPADSLRSDLEATRRAFRDLAGGLPEARWASRAPGSKWTGKQLLHHVTWALEQLPKEVENAKREKGLFNCPKFLADNGSYWLVRWEARNETRETIVARYEAAIGRAIASLQTVSGGEWKRGARFYGEGFYTVADLFHTPAQHLEEHSAPLLGR